VAGDFFQPLDPPRSLGVVACYDDASPVPPNTAAALQFAVEDMLEWIQFDVRRTRDGQHVLWRSPAIGREEVTIADRPYQELNGLDVGSSFAPRFASQRLLTLPDALGQAKARINLWLVLHDVDSAQLAREIAAAQMQSQVLAVGTPEQTSDLAAAGIATALPVPETALVDSAAMQAWQDRFAHLRAVVLSADQATSAHIEQWRGLGYLVAIDGSRTRHEPAATAHWLAARPDLILSHQPEILIADYVKQAVPNWPVRMTLHRGASRYAPENTLPALQQAIRLHADLVEFDIHTTADKHFVLLHDAKLDRTTSGRGPVSQATFEAVAVLDAGAWFAPAYVGTKVPELDAFLTAIAGHADLYVDAKAIEPLALAERLSAHGLGESGVVFQAPAFIQKLRERLSSARGLVPLFDPRQVEKLGQAGKFYGVDARWEQLSAEMIDRCHRAGLAVFADAGGEHQPADYRRVIGWGIDVIQTDYPLRLLRAVELHAQK
jgi:glycerophosphoryl diester phosphodiesterase